MRKITFAFLALIFACNTHAPSNEEMVKKFMMDSIVPSFNDPKSYEFVSIKVDTFYGREYMENIKRYMEDTTLYTSENLANTRKEIAELESIPGYSDSILNFQYKVNFRAKNKMGGLVLGNTRIIYNPHTGSLMSLN